MGLENPPWRVDVAVFQAAAAPIKLSVGGETIESAIAAAMVVCAPHLMGGLGVEVERLGRYCDQCVGYHTSDESHDHDEMEDALSPGDEQPLAN